MTHYKVLVNGHSAHGGTLQWSLPRDGEPGDWHEVEGPIRVCRNGLHLTTDPMQWPTVGMVVYEAEGEGDADTGGSDKTAYRRARLIREAPETIPDYWRAVERFVTEEIPAVPWFQPDGDPDPAWRLFTAPRWNAAGNAARSAAWHAAENAAWIAAGNAAWKAAWKAARHAAGNAAWNAARHAARHAAGNAAENAAGNAARSAAENAAENAAWKAAGSAAGNAAGNAARSAAWSAGLYTRVTHICADLPLDQRHRDHARARWKVWQKGYALLCDVDGVLYVYAQEGA